MRDCPRTKKPCYHACRGFQCMVVDEEARERDRHDSQIRAELLRQLQDPAVVHANMLRGIIAPISIRQAAHIAGETWVTWLNEAEARLPPPKER